ncbi:hypothetical protein QQF64_027595 [Cirrhinus molitorella]|uniref:Uncharacterized protein n=1 Tax=Cirrhinus molitorella TaxID=172907 RepID=A0ABR3NCU3_9TELE
MTHVRGKKKNTSEVPWQWQVPTGITTASGHLAAQRTSSNPTSCSRKTPLQSRTCEQLLTSAATLRYKAYQSKSGNHEKLSFKTARFRHP